MVEILKMGTPPNDRKHTTTCDNCGTRFRFRQSEAESDGDALKIKCPVCGELDKAMNAPKALETETLDQIWKLLQVAHRAAAKLDTMYQRRETERRHEIDTLIEYKDAFYPAMNKIKAAFSAPEPSPDALTLAKQLRSKATEITSEPFMVAVWDAIATYYIEKGATDCGSWPRDVFESHMASLAEELEGAADFIAAPSA